MGQHVVSTLRHAHFTRHWPSWSHDTGDFPAELRMLLAGPVSFTPCQAWNHLRNPESKVCLCWFSIFYQEVDKRGIERERDCVVAFFGPVEFQVLNFPSSFSTQQDLCLYRTGVGIEGVPETQLLSLRLHLQRIHGSMTEIALQTLRPEASPGCSCRRVFQLTSVGRDSQCAAWWRRLDGGVSGHLETKKLPVRPVLRAEKKPMVGSWEACGTLPCKAEIPEDCDPVVPRTSAKGTKPLALSWRENAGYRQQENIRQHKTTMILLSFVSKAAEIFQSLPVRVILVPNEQNNYNRQVTRVIQCRLGGFCETETWTIHLKHSETAVCLQTNPPGQCFSDTLTDFG